MKKPLVGVFPSKNPPHDDLLAFPSARLFPRFEGRDFVVSERPGKKGTFYPYGQKRASEEPEKELYRLLKRRRKAIY